MKKLLWAFFMSIVLCINLRAAGSLTIQPTYWATLDFVDIHAGEGSSIQFNAYVVASGTKAWAINAKYDYFKIEASTGDIIPVGSATYRILKNPCESDFSYILPFNWATIYSSSATEYTTNGTTVTISINLSPEKGIKTGKYRSSLHVELGDPL
jgi:hypothetical protein